jgi:SWIM zinc finger
VISSTGNGLCYDIDVARDTCTCPYFRKVGFCKHMYAVDDYLYCDDIDDDNNSNSVQQCVDSADTMAVDAVPLSQEVQEAVSQATLAAEEEYKERIRLTVMRNLELQMAGKTVDELRELEKTATLLMPAPFVDQQHISARKRCTTDTRHAFKKPPSNLAKMKSWKAPGRPKNTKKIPPLNA